DVKRMYFRSTIVKDSVATKEMETHFRHAEKVGKRVDRLIYNDNYKIEMSSYQQAQMAPMSLTTNDLGYLVAHGRQDITSLRFMGDREEASNYDVRRQTEKVPVMTEWITVEPKEIPWQRTADELLEHVELGDPQYFQTQRDSDRWWEKNFHEYVETAEVSEAAVANEYQAAIAESFRDNIDTNEHFYDPSFEQCSRHWLPSLRHDTAETRQGDYMQALFTSEMHTNTPCPSPGIYLVPKTPIQLAAAIEWLTQQGKGKFTENQFVLLPLTVFGQNDKAHRRPQCEENCRIAHLDADWHKFGTND
ncbi:MAG: hypothetical protein GY738_02445, partial [Pseudoalteromonas sp.]|nr:hypothetical protein [Pseudoalteromonas sp.]